MMSRKKDPYSSSVQKALALYSLLAFTGRAYSLTRLASVLNCSKQTVLRLIEQIERTHQFALETWVDKRQRWFRAEVPNRCAAGLVTGESLQQLVLCRDLVWHLLPDALQKEIAAQTAPKATLAGKSPVQPVAASYPNGFIDYNPHREKIRTLLEAIEDQRVCDVTYRAAQKKHAKRYSIAPLRLIAHGDALYLSAKLVPKEGDKEYDDSLLFAIHRFARIEPTDKRHHRGRRESPGLEAAQSFLGLVQENPCRIQVRFSPQVADFVAERIWSQDQSIQRHKDGSMTMSLTVSNARQGVSWILGFGKEAVLLKPKWLVCELADVAADIVLNHAGESGLVG